MSPPSKVVEAAFEKNWKFVLEVPSGATSSFISGDCLEALRMVVTSDRTGRFLDNSGQKVTPKFVAAFSPNGTRRCRT